MYLSSTYQILSIYLINLSYLFYLSIYLVCLSITYLSHSFSWLNCSLWFFTADQIHPIFVPGPFSTFIFLTHLPPSYGSPTHQPVQVQWWVWTASSPRSFQPDGQWEDLVVRVECQVLAYPGRKPRRWWGEEFCKVNEGPPIDQWARVEKGVRSSHFLGSRAGWSQSWGWQLDYWGIWGMWIAEGGTWHVSSSFYIFFALKRHWLHLLSGEKVFLLRGSEGKIDSGRL